jgi:molybdopterin converting factor small subunit
MKVNVLFFGTTADLVGRRIVEIPIDAEVPARTVIDKILTDFPRLNDHRLHFSVNQEYCVLNTSVKDGDELAVFTAVSGG